MPRHAHWRCALIVVGGRQLKCCEISVMCKFHIKTYHMSNSQNCWSLFLIFSSFVRVCVSAYVVKKHALLCLRTVASYIYLALTLKVHCRCIVDLRKFTGRNSLWQVKVYTQGHTKQSYMCGKAQNPSHENKEAVLASTFSSPPMGRDENVLKCFLLTEFNNNFDSYQKRSLTDVVALGNCNLGRLGSLNVFRWVFNETYVPLTLLEHVAVSHSKHHKSTSGYDRETF